MAQARTDRNNNPTAFTTDIAHMALQEGVDYTEGDLFTAEGKHYHTAKLLGDPIEKTIRVIDKIGFYNKAGGQRWTYIGIPSFIWEIFTPIQKKQIIGWMYGREGGSELKKLFL